MASTKEGDVVLDPFTGSSTTGIAASAFKRKFIGIDMEKKYLDLSIKRHAELEELIKELNQVYNKTPSKKQIEIIANRLAVKQSELFK